MKKIYFKYSGGFTLRLSIKSFILWLRISYFSRCWKITHIPKEDVLILIPTILCHNGEVAISGWRRVFFIWRNDLLEIK